MLHKKNNTNLFFSLPDDILRSIFDYDMTYRQYFSKKIVPIIPYFCVRKEDHLLFRAKEMMGREDSNMLRIWYVYVDSIKVSVHENDVIFQYSVPFVNQHKISRFISLSMRDEDIESFSLCIQAINTEEHFMKTVKPLLETHKHNHIVTDAENQEYYYRLIYNPYPRGLTTDKAFIYSDKDNESLNAVVGIFDGDHPIFFKKKGMTKVLTHLKKNLNFYI